MTLIVNKDKKVNKINIDLSVKKTKVKESETKTNLFEF